MQRIYRTKSAVAVAGMLSGYGTPARTRSLTNAADYTHELWTLGIPAAPTANTAYTVTVAGTTATANTGADTTQAQLETLLLSALRQSDAIYSKTTIRLNSAAHTITVENKTGGEAIAVSVTGADLTATKTVAAVSPRPIQFGRFVGRKAGDTPGTVRLITSLADSPKGVAMATHASEKVGIGPNAVVYHHPNDVLDVVEDTLANEGIWVECVETSGLTEDDTVYISVATGHEGKATKSNSGTLAAGAGVKFRSGVELDPNGNPVVLVKVAY